MASVEGKVVRVVSPSEVVVNLGSKDGIGLGSRFLVYLLGDEVVDPENGESLGQLEIVRGRGQAKHVQERMTTIHSTEWKRVLREHDRAFILGIPMPPQEVEVAAPFEGVKVGDLVRVL